MIEKILVFILAMAAAGAFTACALGETEPAEASSAPSEVQVSVSESAEAETSAPVSEPSAPSEESGEADAESSILVAYFSWADNAVLAEDVDAVASPSVVRRGMLKSWQGGVQEETGGDCFRSR